ncbi:MBL fold metallo-hydrolase, partial [Arthrobacter sp. H5]|uniref:MBL fold metallo-hydrolase n=1 Tax=Arthrobacter sp. H5 TaxID=1267973 RepID=UPI0012DC42DD
MRPIAENCYQLEGSKGANGYLLHGSGHTAVVDPGMNSGYAAVLEELGCAEPAVGTVTDILLTHYDTDHSQVVKRLQQTLNARVWLGAADAAILRGDVPPPTRVRRLLKRLAPA